MKRHENQPDRDAALGEELRRLEVPDHDPDFFSSLKERLQAAPHQAASRPPAPKPKPRRSWVRLAWIPIPVAMVILLLLWAFAGPLGIDSLRPETASAAEIAQKALKAVAETKTLRCTVVAVTDAGAEDRRTVVLSADGSYRITQKSWKDGDGGRMVESGIIVSEAYDSKSGVLRLLYTDENGNPAAPLPDEIPPAVEATGHPLGGPDIPAVSYPLGRLWMGMRDLSDATVIEGAYEGRPTWTLSTALPQNLISNAGPDHMEATVDQETGFPVRMVLTQQGQVDLDMHLEDVQIDPELGAGFFGIEFPEGVEVKRTDHGFQRVEPARMSTEGKAVVGYAPVLPAELPEGYALAEVRVAAQGQAGGKEGMNPAAPGVVSAMYRRGFDQLVVTTRLVGDDPSLWSDPLARGEGFIDDPEAVTLASGAFAGSSAEILIDLLTLPHLWAMNDTLVLTISGDLTRDELLAVAESLAPVE